MSDSPLHFVWNLRAVILFSFPVSSLVFLPSLLVLSFCLVIFLLMVHSPDIFLENSLNR